MNSWNSVGILKVFRKMQRRDFMRLAGGISLLAILPVFGAGAKDGVFAVNLSDDEWKAKLTPEQYNVLRKEGTERAFTSPLTEEHRDGVFNCAGCDWKLFSSAAKYDSGTGWPSFYQPISDKAVGSSTDYKLVYPRTEVHCANCGGHLGHVFDDGPKPTGKRYCMNGVALKFIPAFP